MKKAFLLLAALTIAALAPAQYYHYYNAAPWGGNKAYSLNIGTNLDLQDSTLGFSTKHLPLAVSVRYDAEKDLNETVSLGYQAEVSYLRHGFDYDKIYEEFGWRYSDQNIIGSRDDWNLQLDIRFLLGIYPTENFEIAAGVGFGYDLISGHTGNHYRVYNATGIEVPDSRENDNGIDIFSRNIFASLYLGANYYFSEELFATLSARYLRGFDFFALTEEETITVNRFLVMLGVGYKILR